MAHLVAVGLAGVVLMAAASVWAWFLRKGAAASRQRIWRLSFGALLVMSLLSFVPWYPRLPSARFAAPRASVESVAPLAAARGQDKLPVTTETSGEAPMGAAAAEGPAARHFPLSTVFLVIWLAGVAVLLARWIVGVIRTARWASAALPIAAQAEALGPWLAANAPPSIDVRLHPECIVPLTVGLLRPAIFLPLAAREWDPVRLRVVLLHEIAHLRRHDALHRAVAELGVALHWPNPLTWLAKARLRLDQEKAADDAVLSAGVRPATYATELMALADAAGELRLVGALPMAEKAGLFSRIEHIVATGRTRSESPRLAATATLLFCLATLSLAALPLEPAHASPVRGPALVAARSLGPQLVSCDVLGSPQSPKSNATMAVAWWNDTEAPISIASVDANGQVQAKDAPVIVPGRGHMMWSTHVGTVGVALSTSGACLGAVVYQLGDSNIVLGASGILSGRVAEDRRAALVAAQERYNAQATCNDVANLKSPGGDLNRSIRLWNDTDGPISIDLILESGKRVFDVSLAPGAVKDWRTLDWHLFVASTSDGRCLAVTSAPTDGQDVVFTAEGVLRGARREARIDELALAKARASEMDLATCRSILAKDGSTDPVKASDCRAFLRSLAGAYDSPATPPEGGGLEGGFTDDFERADLGPSYFASSARWHIVDGEVVSSNAKNQPLWLKSALARDVQIEFDARSESPEGDIKCELFGDGYSHGSGYVLILGGWENSLTVLSRLTRLSEQTPPVENLLHGLSPSGRASVQRRDLRVEPGRWYHWLIRRQGATILWQVDGKTVFEETDPQPLAGPGHDRFGFGGWGTEVHFDNLKVVPLG